MEGARKRWRVNRLTFSHRVPAAPEIPLAHFFFVTSRNREEGRVSQVVEGAKLAFHSHCAFVFNDHLWGAKEHKRLRVCCRRNNRGFQSALGERAAGIRFVKTSAGQESSGRAHKFPLNSPRGAFVRQIREAERKKKRPSSLMKPKWSQTTRGNEKKKKPPPFSPFASSHVSPPLLKE